jgi:hypothetical protein
MISQQRATRLLLIRAAMLAGVLLFGAVTWYLEREGRLSTISAERAQMLGYVFMALTGAALVAMFFIRGQLAQANEARQLTLHIVGYAIAEGAALFGAVVWFIGGAREWYVAGVVLMVVAFQILPVKRE